ncbi:unnamed protein product [Polarella glacialis]|uniref:C2H2-type domain-containing protein n=1 Tax=Polarella glacialis TaxID=89957 RepID=A0A813LMM2_POLGL|nr:unnamed protein product [Polarella glacialis]CAE8732584.1 unnamed protein product [Polarella glacialis]
MKAEASATALASSTAAHVCRGCGRSFFDSLTHAAHESQCKAVSTCPGCDGFFSEKEFRQHVSLRACDAAACGVCNIVFSCVEECHDHCRQTHEGRGVQHLLKPRAATPRRATIGLRARKEGAPVPRRRSTDKDLLLPCPGCSRRFDGAALLKAHSSSARATCPARSCLGCGLTFASSKLCDDHMRTCTKVVSCPSCFQHFASAAELETHTAHSGLPARRPPCLATRCVGCGLVFCDAAEAQAHEEACWSVLQCPGCDGHFGSAADFSRHVGQHKTGCSALQCSCGTVFGTTEEAAACHCRRRRPRAPSRPLVGYSSALPSIRTGRAVAGSSSGGLLALTAPGASPSEDGQQPRESHTPRQKPPAEGGISAATRCLAIESELRGLADSSPELRTQLRRLQLCWHPDQAWRVQVDSDTACQVFAFVQEIWQTRMVPNGQGQTTRE